MTSFLTKKSSEMELIRFLVFPIFRRFFKLYSIKLSALFGLLTEYRNKVNDETSNNFKTAKFGSDFYGVPCIELAKKLLGQVFEIFI